MCCKLCVAQNPSFKHYDVSNGLPTNEVYEIRQDSKGFLWIGCDAGLVRYDGNSFKLLSNKKNRGPAISGLREDKQGRIWATNFSGQIFFTTGDSLQLFEPWEKNYHSNFADVAIDKNNYLYVTNYNNKIYRYNLADNKEEIAVNDNKAKLFVFATCDGSVLFTLLDSGLIKRITPGGTQTVPKLQQTGEAVTNPTLNNFVFYNSFKNKQTLGFQRINFSDKEPYLYYYKDNALFQHPVTAILQNLKAYPTCCFDDDDGNLFVGTSSELLWFKKTITGEWILFNRMLQGNGLSFISEDKEGSIWITTLKNGIYKIPNKNIWTIPQSVFNTRAASINHITSDGKQTLFGSATSGEIFSYDINTHLSRNIKTPEQRDAQALAYNCFTDELFVSKVSTVAFSNKQKTISDWSKLSSNAKDFFFRKDGAFFTTGSGVSVLFNSNNKKLRQTLLNEFDTVYLSWNQVTIPEKERFVISEQRCKGIWYQEAGKILWIGFVDGLAYYENKKAQKLTDPATNQFIIATGFNEDSEGTLYISTVEQGIFVLKDKKIIHHYTISEGLLSNRIKQIKLSQKYLWMISGGALQAMELQTKKIKTINTTDGLLSSEIYDLEILQDTVYVATANGIQFFPENIETQNNMSPVSMITGMQADENKINTDKGINLAYNTKNISIYLQGIALKSEGGFFYEYRLLPDNKNWIKISANENIVRFSSLASGKYSFQSRVVNEDGVMSAKINELNFIIKNPWWLQWWFLTLAFLFAALLIYIVFKSRIKANRQKLEEELSKSKIQEELRQSQLSSLKAQMNPHFMFNALNSIQEFILTNDKRQANMYMGKFADLMRMTLDMSNKKEITLDDEIKVLELYLQLEALRFEEKFQYKIEIAENVHTAEINLPSMLIQPYVENAVKHGLLHIQDEKILSVVFNIENENVLTCTITDNGIGRKRSNELNEMRQKRYTSFATGATQKRLELLNHEREAAIAVVYEDLRDGNGNASGTRVTLKIPV